MLPSSIWMTAAAGMQPGCSCLKPCPPTLETNLLGRRLAHPLLMCCLNAMIPDSDPSSVAHLQWAPPKYSGKHAGLHRGTGGLQDVDRIGIRKCVLFEHF